MTVELAYTLFFQGKVKEAKQIVKRILEKGKDPKATLLLAWICFQESELQSALEAIEETINSDAKLFEAWVLRAKILHKMGRPAEALESLDKAYELRQVFEEYEDYEILILKARILLEMGNLDLARKEIEKARKLNPYDEEILDIEKELGSGVVK
ncbi:MAG: tetratricopeptide repeat protein [Crenarchaeota archaeon]|nr:tetratricopeptide repeat protein [Thermoproteota archaeon]MCR8454704.1 tetratricopeptide repeat protein [Thermoproteota archaeon]MCR8454771.1 tetratricopeptide repeat protein [Thermoproteota archaeon]MCR8462663.1 tetratricopeptide repeat protein [Thermoproteota archaeon]MCR8470282.1 tetratricopeptide repeat protein [Thermoproteota archaeon]